MADSAKGGYAKSGATGTHDYTHSDFTYVRRKRRGGHAHGAHDDAVDAGELNIVPYLDILINLIMFLLVAQATLVSLGLIDVTAPSPVTTMRRFMDFARYATDCWAFSMYSTA